MITKFLYKKLSSYFLEKIPVLKKEMRMKNWSFFRANNSQMFKKNRILF